MSRLKQLALPVLVVLTVAAGQDSNARALQTSGVWRDVSDARLPRSAIRDGLTGRLSRTVAVDRGRLTATLAAAPREFTADAASRSVELEIPWPDGTFRRFRIEDSPIFESGLSAVIPGVVTLRGQGIDDPTASARFDWTQFGFHAFVLSAEGTVYVDPASPADADHYVSYFQRDYTRKGGSRFTCGVTSRSTAERDRRDLAMFQPPHGATLRTYRTVVAATQEYTASFGGTVPNAMAAIVTSMNRVTSIYERDFAVRFTLVANNDAVVATAEPDGYTNGDAALMMGQNQANLDAVIGSANYDIGHVFSTGLGGFAFLGVVCDPSAKAFGVTGSPSPVGDAFDVDQVAHEIGHQFGGNHSFNGTTGACNGSRNSSTAYEPASGSTIMAHAGRCGAEDLQPHADPYFHAISQQEVLAFVTNGATGGSCSANAPTGNTPPTVTAGGNYFIPTGTPFVLTASANDVDGDAVTYSWEEFDLGAASPPHTDEFTANRPIFRSFEPGTSPSRVFPQLSDLQNNVTTLGESLPVFFRIMTFVVTARDNRSGGGGTSSATTTVQATGSGPFRVTAPNSAVSWVANSVQTITWGGGFTSGPPINLTAVKISLSTDGGSTFPTVLLANTPNDGTQTLMIPNLPTTTARIKVEAIGNIFFDMSDVNFTIADALPTTLTVTPGSMNFAATKVNAGSDLVHVTPPQMMTVGYVGVLPDWTATTSAPWLLVTNGSGTGAGQFTLSIVNPGNVIGGSTFLTAIVTLSAPSASSVPIPVQLSVTHPGSTSPPFGQVDAPIQDAPGVQGGFGISGWALDDIGVANVRIYRSCVVESEQCAFGVDPAAPLTPMLFVGEASILPGARPDIEAAFPGQPSTIRAGWGMLVLSNMLPRTIGPFVPYGGQGPLTLYAIATDLEGRSRLLGRVWQGNNDPTRITMDNDSIAKPFGALDVPSQGGSASGTAFPIFGWVLTPDLNAISDGTDILVPLDGSQPVLFIDGVSRGSVIFNLCRGSASPGVPASGFCDDDVANIFGNATPQPPATLRTSNPTLFRNLDANRGAIGLSFFDTTTLANGLHSIAWSATDSAGRVEGIGSRNFVVVNTGVRAQGPSAFVAADGGAIGLASSIANLPQSSLRVSGKTGFDTRTPARALVGNARGVRTLALPLLSRAEIAFGSTVSAGYLSVGSALRPLPAGSALDAMTGMFTWAPAPGYIGTYRLVFVVPTGRVDIDVTVR